MATTLVQRDPKDKFFINKRRNPTDIFYDSEDDWLKNVPISSIYKPRQMLKRMKDDDYLVIFEDEFDSSGWGGTNPDGRSYDLSVKASRERMRRFSKSARKRKKFENSVQLLRRGHQTFYELNNLLNFRPDGTKKKIIGEDQMDMIHDFKPRNQNELMYDLMYDFKQVKKEKDTGKV
jgi:hypothetical protein